MKLFAVCSPGLERFVARELGQLSLSASPPTDKEVSDERGGIEFKGSLMDVYRCNLHLRTASRVLVRLGSFYAAGFPELRRKASRLSWEDYVTAEKPLEIRVTCHKSRLYHQRAVAERIEGSVSDRLGHPVQIAPDNGDTATDSPSQNPASRVLGQGRRVEPQLVLVRLLKDQCTISIDSSGELLHRRGYRLAASKAPLRETLAAAMLLASGWDGASPLLDPFCGSGTIPIEAALMARHIPPGRGRHFAFMEWPSFSGDAWDSLLLEKSPSYPSSFPKIVASDRDAGAIQAAQANAERAGVVDGIAFSCHAVSSIEPPPGPGWVVTNPPYGVRTTTNQDLRNLYAQIGKVLRAKCLGWQITVLCSSAHLLAGTRLELDPGIPLTNGGIKVRLVRGIVNEG